MLLRKTNSERWAWIFSFYLRMCDALRNLAPLVKFKKNEKHPWRSITFSKSLNPATLLVKVALLHWYFSRFLNCANDTKVSHIVNGFAEHIRFNPYVVFPLLISTIIICFWVIQVVKSSRSWLNSSSDITPPDVKFCNKSSSARTQAISFYISVTFLTWLPSVFCFVSCVVPAARRFSVLSYFEKKQHFSSPAKLYSSLFLVERYATLPSFSPGCSLISFLLLSYSSSL